MGKNGRISQYRERLDRTLASPELTNHDALKTLVRNQLLRSSHDDIQGCSENVITKRTTEVSSFLDMLRSASVSENAIPKAADTTHGEWKLKDDNEEFRVMYRQGPQGTPFHTLLVEGYVDATIDTCLCISWESNLYKKWWPQYNFPPFKITMCECLQNVRVGEQISLMRVKITWPLSTREAVLHYFAFEFLQDGLIVVLVNTISDLEDIDRATHGFTKDGIPEPKDVVRIDLVGGFALQKVTSERSYFRTIANMDMKLDFVPPSLINFISRQLIGSGFRLYQKAVASLSTFDKDYGEALNDPMYTRIRESLYSIGGTNEATEATENNRGDEERNVRENLDKQQYGHKNDDTRASLSENGINMNKKVIGEIEEEKDEEVKGMEVEVHSGDHSSETLENDALATDLKVIGEIEEEESEDIGKLDKGREGIGQLSTSQIVNKKFIDRKRNSHISPAVKQALEILEKAISVVRESGFNAPAMSRSSLANKETTNLDKSSEKDTILLKDNGVCSNAEASVDELGKERKMERTSHKSRSSSVSADIRHTVSNSLVSQNRIVPSSPEQYLPVLSKSNHPAVSPLKNGITEAPVIDLHAQRIKKASIGINGINENGLNGGNKRSQDKRLRLCCFGFNSG